MDIKEAYEVMNALFDYLHATGDLDDEDLRRMNDAEDVIWKYIKDTGGEI